MFIEMWTPSGQSHQGFQKTNIILRFIFRIKPFLNLSYDIKNNII